MIQLNIIFPSTPGSSKWFLSFRFPHQNPVYASPLPHMCYMRRPSHPSRFYHPNNTQRPQIPCYLVPHRPKYSPQHPILKHPQPAFIPQCQRPSFTPIQNRQNYCSLYLNFLIFSIAKWKTKDSAPNTLHPEPRLNKE